MLNSALAFNLFALAALIPAAVVPLRSSGRRDGPFWAVTLLAVAGPGAWAVEMLSTTWHTDLGTALWISIAATAALFAVVAGLTAHAWRLAPLLMPYLAVLGIFASLAPGEAQPMNAGAPVLWVDVHIIVSVATYAVLTMAAVASLGVFLQERALKRKRPTSLTRLLPSVADGERLAGRLLLASGLVLGIGVVTGMTTQYFETGTVLRLGHKTLLSLVALALIGALQLGHRVCGVRGRIAARVVLMAYLSLTLAYVGVKFVTQVLL
ncbi:MAG: cytochrome c biogenesis protein CcsA [Magnetospirillum sp.]|nr:cytochrome c biogenesis protein CcsA [Magnetospirillum sp.]